MLETAERLTDEEREPACSCSCCWSGGLRALAEGEHDPALVLDAFLLRALSRRRLGAALRRLRALRRPRPAPGVRGARRAGRSARSAARPGAARPAPETLELLAALLSGDWGVADASEVRAGAARPAAWSPPTCSGTWSAVRSLRLVERDLPAAARRGGSRRPLSRDPSARAP